MTSEFGSEYDAAGLYIGTGNVYLEPGYSRYSIKPLSHPHVIFETVAEDVHDHGRIELPEKRKFLVQKNIYTGIFEPDRVQHS